MSSIVALRARGMLGEWLEARKQKLEEMEKKNKIDNLDTYDVSESLAQYSYQNGQG
jgi:hypothetical protein